MNKEPLGLYILRFFISGMLLVFFLMLYWSSTLVETDLKAIRSEISQIKNDLNEIHSAWNAANATPFPMSNPSKNNQKTLPRTHIDPSLPNLLEEDSFYTSTLPKILGSSFKPRGVFQRAELGKPENLHPFANWRSVSELRGLCVPSIARLQFGKYETLAPDLAIKMEERENQENGKKEFWVHLREGLYWQPLHAALFSEEIQLAPHFTQKHPVTAHDFKFYFDAMMNPYNQESGAVSGRTYYGDIESFDVVDDFTFIVRWKAEAVKEANGEIVYKPKYVAGQLTGGLKPLPRFVYQYFPDGKKIIDEDNDSETYRKNPVWAQNFSHHWAKNIIVGCGAWIFEKMTDRLVTFKRNPHYFTPYDALAEGIEIQFKDTSDAMWQQFKINSLDNYEIRPEQLTELDVFLNSPQYKEQVNQNDLNAIKKLTFLARQYTYIGWNQAKPFFKSKKVRQALTMAIDRRRIISQILNNMGVEITGTFYINSPAYDPNIQPWPYDIQRAKQLLEEEGWYDSDGDGVIDKNIDGKVFPFSFNLMYYVKGHTGKAIAEYVSTGLREIGIDCRLQGVDIADLSAAFENKSFDAIMMAWGLGTPPDDPKQLWYSKESEKGSSNAIGFSNQEADAIIDKLLYESDAEKRTELYHRFDAILHEEAPYTFLYTPKITMLYRDYLQNVFIPADRQDLIPGANIGEPDSSIFWLRNRDVQDGRR